MLSGVAGKLFTWVDVDARLAEAAAAGRWPDWLVEADAWWDGLELTLQAHVTPDHVREWLDSLFGLGSVAVEDEDEDAGELELALDRAPAQPPVALPVRLVRSSGTGDAASAEPARRPRLAERRVTAALAQPLPRPASAEFAAGTQVIAFHSFKGGVGRTLHAVALADLLASRGRQVLLVDADLEAPGITWMYQAQGGRCDISYEDVLALLHSARQGDATEAVGTAAAYLLNQRVSRYPGLGRVTVLPASRRERLGPPRIGPVDLLTEDRSPYFLSESLAALAVAAGADTVVVDLRAGASELSAPILLDPRVMRIFVTTVSSQSLQGTLRLIRQLGSQAPALAGQDPTPGAIVTQYRRDAHASAAELAREDLSDALAATLELASAAEYDLDELAVDEQVLTKPLLSPFREELLALPQSWEAVTEAARRSGLVDLLSEFAAPREADGTSPLPAPANPDVSRRSLADTAGRLVYAEKSGADSSLGFLTTEPVRRLIADHSTDLPIAVVVGAKGSGKTFTFARMCAARTWDAFARQNGQSGLRAAAIVPVLDPVNMTGGPVGALSPQVLRDRAAEFSGIEGGGITAQEIRDHLDAALKEGQSLSPEFWRERWLECLAWSAGSERSAPAKTELFARAQAGTGCLFVLDGLEDWLENVETEPKRIALRTLLQDVPSWLRRLRGGAFGLVVFVRQDLVRAAIRQNLGQFLDRYSSYELRWEAEDALRLSLWVASEAKAVSAPAGHIADLTRDEIAAALVPLWGRKLGTEESREAWSNRWVPAALADFNGQVQARDVVRFLSEAAAASLHDERWTDRVLAPAAMRKALDACSREKLREITEENPRLGALMDGMGEYSDTVRMPFDPADVGLSAEDIEALEQWGALAGDKDGRYRMPEIYRHALGFRTQGRARVVRSQ